MFKNLSIRIRLALVMIFFGILLVACSAMGISGVLMSNSDVNELYSSRLVSSKALADANVALSRTRLFLYRIALDPTSPEVPKETQTARDLLNASKNAWDAYRTLPFAESDEGRRAADTNTKLETLVANGLEPMFRAIASHDAAKIREVWLQIPLSLFIDVSTGMDVLGQIQIATARATFDSAQTRFHRFVAIAIAGFLAASGAAVFAWWSLQRAIGRPLRQAIDHFRAIADGDLTTRVEVHSRDEMGQLMSGLQTMQSKLIRTISVVRVGSQSINTAAQEISAGNMDLSQRTEEQAASLEETASSMEELTSTVRQNADSARQANALATRATNLAEAGNDAVQDMVGTIERISGSSSKISEITGVIEGIAFQTNILALNAAVEAARAGEQGRGFAVVASEVRSLAQRSASAAKEIKELINSSVAMIQDGAKQATDVGATMVEVKQAIKQVSGIVGEITSASEDQSQGIGQVNQAVIQMDEVTQRNAALVEQAAAAAHSLEEQAQNLKESVSVFRLTDTGPSLSRAVVPQSRLRNPVHEVSLAREESKAVEWTADRAAGVAAAVSHGSTANEWETF
ncbi:methyl-accepting chemotaxis protein [Paraburkholderia sp. GAS32]|uniref:methyl-accepting chemotaxis protein n=1 Tax=Paraburkholderia sp. GAS32 TaxID=3035129 RepID=UPI003D1933EE